ncbi:glycerate kinase type-2 family protein [Nitrosophilus alvini]|uniref:glycerate kinase type-2 family protein n=1 Tax=Nitrosophilus alvini TaxID=2714855 RepID=UPI00190C5ADF|nr:DUF4147 domain-containing protein [Nitrosophilus alvini]
MKLRTDALDIFRYAVDAVLPENLVKTYVRREGKKLFIEKNVYDLEKYENIYILGAGKASARMAKALYPLIEDVVTEGTVVSLEEGSVGKIKLLKGSHPIPSKGSEKGAEALMEIAGKTTKNDLSVFLLSGGASALAEKPLPPVTLDDLRLVTGLLLKSGADINEVNIVRKHISMIKGGRLASLCKGEAAVLIISDVIGDDLQTIGSAPCYFDSSSFKDAAAVLKKYAVSEKVPQSVKEVLKKGLEKVVEETPKAPKKKIKHFLIGSNKKALEAAKQKAVYLGYRTFVVTDKMCGEAKDVGAKIAQKALNTKYKKDFCWLFGGETTVNVKGDGKGGRNQEMALSALEIIKEKQGIVFLSAGTDGIDANTDAAGACADCYIYERSRDLGLDIKRYLRNNDSYTFFEKVEGLIVTGPTGTNVMDITVVLKRGRDG